MVPNERRTLREDQRKGNAALEPHLIQEIVSTVVFTLKAFVGGVEEDKSPKQIARQGCV